MVNETVVTASHAIFVEKDGYRAPAAVVGLQYKNSAFRETFFNITSGVLHYNDAYIFFKKLSTLLCLIWMCSALEGCLVRGHAATRVTWLVMF